MSKLRPPPLDSDVAALVRRAAAIEVAPADARARVFSRVTANAFPPGGDGGGASGGSRETGTRPSPPKQPGGWRRLLPLAASFALGAAAGGAAIRVAMHGPPQTEAAPARIMHVGRADATVEPIVPARPSPEPDIAPPTTVDAPPATASTRLSPGRADIVPPPPPIAATEQLAAERILLDGARGALEREEGAAALAATDRHKQKYPRGILAQEREAMAVRALLLLQRRDEARARVERFRATYGQSVLLPALAAAVSDGTNP